MMSTAETTEGMRKQLANKARVGLATKGRKRAFWNVRCAAVALGCISASSIASAENATTSQEVAPSVEDVDSEWIKAGIEAYKKRDYAVARDSLIRAWEHSHLGTVAGILADAEMKLQRYAEAAEHWTEYLRLLPEDSTTERQEGQRQLAVCREHVGLLIVHVGPTEASLVIDGAELLGRPKALHEVWLPFGEHVVQAKANGQLSPAKTIAVAQGSDLRIGLETPTPTVPTTSQAHVVGPLATKPSSMEHPSSSKSGLSTKTIVLLTESALTVAAIGIGIGSWIAYTSADHDATKLREQIDTENKDPAYAKAPCTPLNPSRPMSCESLTARLGDRTDAAEIVNVAMPVAGILAAVTVGTYLLWPRAEKHPVPVGGVTPKTLALVPYWSPGNQGLTARMQF